MNKANSLFIAEVKKQQSITKLTYKDLERITGVPKSTISAFMCGAREGEDVKLALAKALEIKIDP
ncbi:MAG: helix-turn-helix domain-containing protein [Eubacterium sp.]|nr:helix-turn-helix domain-containing protein [Eubacterium sp.]